MPDRDGPTGVSEGRRVTAPRFLLLHLRPHAEIRLPDLSLCIVAGWLRAMGHATLLVHAELPDADADTTARELELGAWLTGRVSAAPIIIVERLWPMATLERLRERLGARLWWLSQEVDHDPGRAVDFALGLEHGAVCAFAGLLASEETGYENVPGLAWRGADDRLRVPGGAPPRSPRAALMASWCPVFEGLRFPHGDELEPTEQLLLGRPGGCPYRADARDNPLFADLDLDPAKCSVNGCTFCLTPRSSDRVFEEHDEKGVVDFLVRQIAHLARAAPKARRLVLADDRPLPLLAPLFESLAPHTLGPRTLLLKLRADDLVRHERMLQKAGERAAALGWRLALYCIGFESFSDHLLRLFNKGVSARTVERAVALALALDGAPGISIESSRAHGFLLWTPWTRLEDLVTCARVARRCGFEALREDWTETRLRLDPRLPLFVRAAEDGLLADDWEAPDANRAPASQALGVRSNQRLGYEGARVDRGLKQGYERSAPWRFADPRAALADRLLSRGLAERSFALSPDEDGAGECAADRLERVALEVRRLNAATVRRVLSDPVEEERLAENLRSFWCLGSVEPYHVAAVQAAGLPPPAWDFDVAVETVRAGRRRAGILEAVEPATATPLAAHLRNLAVSTPDSGGLEVSLVRSARALRGDQDAFDLLVACDPAVLQELEEAHLKLCGREQAPVALLETGRLLGYPPCCTKAFAALPDRSDDVANLVATLERTGARGDPRLNPFAPLPFISFHPCRFDCPAAIEVAAASESLMDELLGVEARKAALRAAAMPQLIFGRRLRYVLLGTRFQGAKLGYQKVAGPPGPLLGLLSHARALAPSDDGLRLETGGGGGALLAPRLTPVGDTPLAGVVLTAWQRAPKGTWAHWSPPAAQSGESAMPPSPLRAFAAGVVSLAAEEGFAPAGRERRAGGAIVLRFMGHGVQVRLELAPPESGTPAYAKGAHGRLSYKVSDTDGRVVALNVAPTSARRLVERAASQLT